MQVGALFPRSVPSGRPASLSSGAGWLARPGLSAWLLPSIADLVFIGCLLVALKAGAKMLSADGDPGRHLAVGSYILAGRSIPHQDVWSHTMAGEVFVPYEWLAEVASAASYALAATAGPVVLHGVAIGLSFAVLYGQLRHRRHTALLSLGVTLMATLASMLHWLARPHVFTFLGTAVFGAVLDGWYSRRLSARWLWLLPALMVVWANVHGGFLIGLVLLGAYAGADVLRRLAAGREVSTEARRRLVELLPAAATTGLATFINPAGPELLLHVTGYLDKKLLVDRTQEYLSPNFHDGDVKAFLAMLLVSTVAMAWSRRRPALHEGLLFAGFTYFALFAARNIPLFAIVVAPVLAAQLSALPAVVSPGGRLSRIVDAGRQWVARRDVVYTRVDGQAKGHLWPLALVVAAVALAAAGRQAGQTPLGLDFDPKLQPVAAAAYLRQNPPVGNGFNELRWGGYLLHTLWPEQRVFIDGQTDFYGEALTHGYLTVTGLEPGWEQVLEKYDVSWVLFATDSLLVRQLSAMPDWEVEYQDKLATILVRTEASGR